MELRVAHFSEGLSIILFHSHDVYDWQQDVIMAIEAIEC